MSDKIVNIPLLRKAVEWAEAEAMKPPGLCEWNQEAYRYPWPQRIGRDAACGTCYCVAGFVTSVVRPEYAAGAHVGDAAEIAAEALGIECFDGDSTAGVHLFSDDNSIEDIRRIAESLAGERL